MTTFCDQAEDGRLRIEGVSVDELATKYGTPLFVYSEATLRSTFRRFAKAFTDRYPAEVIVCAGLKANCNQAVRRVIVSEGGGGDVFGIGEMTAALATGSDPRKVVMNGPCKPRDAIRLAIEAGILINLDSTSEVESVASVARELGRTARISIRLRLGMDVLDGKYWVDPRYRPPGVDLGPEMRTEKFGMEPSAAEQALKASLERPGYGPPWSRPASTVAGDVSEGRVSRERARDVYGVVFTSDSVVDESRTNQLRTALAAAGAPAGVTAK